MPKIRSGIASDGDNRIIKEDSRQEQNQEKMDAENGCGCYSIINSKAKQDTGQSVKQKKGCPWGGPFIIQKYEPEKRICL